MAEKIIIDIEMSSEDVRRAEKQIAAARAQVEALRDANKSLDKSSEAYTKNAVQIKKLNSEIRTNERVLIANEKARDANKGSVEQLREQLKVVSVQWAKEAKAMGENSEEAKRLAAQKTTLTAQLKAVEKQTGDTRRNVGNYSEGMREALASSTELGQGTNNLFNLLKANPLLLVITLFAKFASAVSKAQFIVDGFNSVFEPLNQMFQRAIGLVQELIDGGFSKIAEILQDPIGALMSFGEEMEKAAESGRRLAELTIEIEEAQNSLIITEGKLKREIEEQRFAVEDLSKSSEERQDAAEKALEAVKQLEAERLKVLNKQIEAAELRAAQNDTDRQAQKELNELLAQRDEIAAQSVSQAKEIRNQLNTVNKQQQDEEKRANAERVKNFEEAEAKKTEAMRKESERRAEVIKEEIKRNNDLYLLGLKEQLLAQEITRDEYDQRLAERELDLLEAQRAALFLSGQDTTEIDNKIADHKIANLKRVAEVESQGFETQKDLKQSELSLASDISGTLVGITKKTAGENATITKAAALAQSGINIAQSITKALADTGPIIGPILGAISAALGAVQTAKIRSTRTNFAEGVIGLQGPGTETSDSIPANLSKGESVMTARATKVYGSQLAEMERSVGNTPNYQLGNYRFNKGIIAAGSLPSVNSGRSAVSEARILAEEVSKMRIFLSLTELESKQTDFNQAQRFAQITD